jgi:hypothetical protein
VNSWWYENGRHVVRGVLLAFTMLAAMAIVIRWDLSKPAPAAPVDTPASTPTPPPSNLSPKKPVPVSDGRVPEPVDPRPKPVARKSQTAATKSPAKPVIYGLDPPAELQHAPAPAAKPVAPKPIVEEVTLEQSEPSQSIEPTDTTSKRMIRGVGRFFKVQKEKQ